MSQLFSFEGMWLTLEQIEKIRAERENKVEEIKDAASESLPVPEQVEEAPTLSRKEVMDKLREKGVKFKATVKTEELINLLNQYEG